MSYNQGLFWAHCSVVCMGETNHTPGFGCNTKPNKVICAYVPFIQTRQWCSRYSFLVSYGWLRGQCSCKTRVSPFLNMLRLQFGPHLDLQGSKLKAWCIGAPYISAAVHMTCTYKILNSVPCNLKLMELGKQGWERTFCLQPWRAVASQNRPKLG